MIPLSPLRVKLKLTCSNTRDLRLSSLERGYEKFQDVISSGIWAEPKNDVFSAVLALFFFLTHSAEANNTLKVFFDQLPPF